MKEKKNLAKGVKGVKDITPADISSWRRVEESALEILELYNFREIRIPIFEKTEIFRTSIGETSDIVEKEMYTFSDRGGESLTLRPEGTASVTRAFVEHKLYNSSSAVKLFYIGPMFRAERPQAGRFRQFHQIGAEVFGSMDPAVDSEIIIMLMDIFGDLQISDLNIRLNSLGCPDCRPGYRDALLSFLKGRAGSLCENCQARIDRNPLRALDCKSRDCRQIVVDAPAIDKFLCNACQDHIDQVRKPLLDLELPITMDPTLVRGLDYYSRTAFEVISDQLGAQNAVAGGGRYDNLVERFGGPPTPAIGFAIGMERMISLLSDSQTDELPGDAPDVYMVILEDVAKLKAFELAHRMRSFGYRVERNFDGGSMKSQMRKADKSGARFSLIIGEDEIGKDVVTIRNMKSGEQRQSPFNDIIDELDSEFDTMN